MHLEEIMQKKIVSLCAGKARGIYKDMPGEVLDFLLLEVALRLMVLSPALFLLTDQWKFLALLCIPLFLLVVPFARERAAENMQDALSGGHLFSGNLVSFSGYFGSFGRGLKTGFFLLLWASPFIGVTVWLYRVIFGTTVVGQTDVISVIMALNSLGGGDLVKGGMLAFVLYLLTLLPFCFGLAFHSGNRHARAMNPSVSLKGRRKTVIKVWLRSLTTLIPFAAVSGWSVISYLLKVVNALNQISGKGLNLPKPDSGLYIVLLACAVLLLPLLPLKSLMTAACVRECGE